MRNILIFLCSILLLIGCKDDSPTGPGTNNPMNTDSALPFVEIVSATAIENEPKVPASVNSKLKPPQQFSDQLL